jgi:hypothetical protein
MQLSCGHYYHRDCFVDMIVRTGGQCAICRKNVRRIVASDVPKVDTVSSAYHRETYQKLQQASIEYAKMRDEYVDVQDRLTQLTADAQRMQTRIIKKLEQARPSADDIRRVNSLRCVLGLAQAADNPSYLDIWAMVS